MGVEAVEAQDAVAAAAVVVVVEGSTKAPVVEGVEVETAEEGAEGHSEAGSKNEGPAQEDLHNLVA